LTGVVQENCSLVLRVVSVDINPGWKW
jgi:hypothetical protein